MNEKQILNELEKDLASLGDKPRTPDVRRVGAAWFKRVKDRKLKDVLALCEGLLDKKRWALTIIAYDWAYRLKRYYTEDTFDTFARWVTTYVEDWWDCDDFCTHALGEVLHRYPTRFQDVIRWCEHERFAVRRSAAVALIPAIKAGFEAPIDPFLIADRLMHDAHYLVLKGYGWMLKVLSTKDPTSVINYLEKHKDTMPRVAYRYALEKFDSTTRNALMQS